MTARATMADLITQLRAYTMASTADIALGTVTYFTDQHLQDALENYQAIYDFETMTSFSQRSGSVYVYKIYETGVRWWEGTPTITDSVGTSISGTAFTFNSTTGRATFTNDQGGSSYTFSGTAYNLYGAAADVWQQKADYYALAYDVSTDNHNLSRSQLLKQAKDRAAYYASLAQSAGVPGASGSGNSIDMERGDTNHVTG